MQNCQIVYTDQRDWTLIKLLPCVGEIQAECWYKARPDLLLPWIPIGCRIQPVGGLTIRVRPILRPHVPSTAAFRIAIRTYPTETDILQHNYAEFKAIYETLLENHDGLTQAKYRDKMDVMVERMGVLAEGLTTSKRSKKNV